LYDASGSAFDAPASTSQLGVGLALHGSNDVIIQIIGADFDVTSISSPYSTKFALSSKGEGQLLNSAYGNAPTWTIVSGDASVAAMSFMESPGIGVTSRSDTLSDSRPSVTSNHTIAFTINNSLDTTGWGNGAGGDATDTVTVAFPFSFNLSNISCKDVDISFGGTATSIAGYNVNRSTRTNCPGSATSWGLFIDTSANVLTFYTPTAVRTYVATGTPVQILIGTNASFQDAASQWLTNPATAGIYTISVGGTFGGSGNMLVSINSAATVQVAVAESLAFTVSSVKAVNCTADDGATVTAVDTSPTSVPLGTLFPVNTFFTGCQDLVVSTNAGNGYSITVQEQTLMHTSGGFTFPQTACDGAACTLATAAAWSNPANNGFGHTCSNQDGNHDCASTYSSGTKFPPTANVAAGHAAQTLMASSTPASVTARIKYRISAGIQQATGTYTTVIVYTIPPTY